MSIAQSDILLLNVIKQGIADLRKHPFFIDFVFEYDQLDLVNLNYGKKEIERAKNWFLQNYIDVGFEWSFDQARYPSIIISNPSSVESKPMASLGDCDMPHEEYITEQDLIEQPIYILGPINVSYDLSSGIVTLPNTLIEYPFIFKGQGLVSKKSNTVYPIEEILSEKEFRIQKNVRDDFTESYVRPQFNKLKINRHIAHFEQKYEITCRVNGETAAIIWLHDILLYILLRYRSLLEQNTFSLSSVSSTGVNMENDEAHGKNIIYSKTIYMDSLVQSRWVQDFSQLYEGVITDINLVKINDPTKTVYAKLLKT